jgi:hypothetical protein
MAYYPEEKLAVIVLANLNGYATGNINTALAAVMHGETVAFPSPPKEIALPKEVLVQYVGTYKFSDRVVFTLEGGHRRRKTARRVKPTTIRRWPDENKPFKPRIPMYGLLEDGNFYHGATS